MNNISWKNILFSAIKSIILADINAQNIFDEMIISGDHCEEYARNCVGISVRDVKTLSPYKAKGNIHIQIFVPNSDPDNATDLIDNLLNEKWHFCNHNLEESVNIFLRKNGLKIDFKKDRVSIEYLFYAVLEVQNGEKILRFDRLGFSS